MPEDREDSTAAGPAAQPPAQPDSIIKPAPREASGSYFGDINLDSGLGSEQRFVAPDHTTTPTQQRRPLPWKGAAITLGILALVGTFAGGIYALYLRPAKVDPATIVQPSASDTAIASFATPQEAVTGYLEALAAGDIATALQFGPRNGNGSAALLSTQTYGQLPAEARPSEIDVLTEDPLATEVEVAYLLAGEQVQTKIPVERTDDGSYQLTRTTTSVIFRFSDADDVPLLVGGTEVEHNVRVELAPGSYELTTGLPFIEFPSEADLEITSLASDEPVEVPIAAQLSEEGKTAFRSAATAALQNCLAQPAYAPADCPNQVQPAKSANESSVEWKLSNDPWADFNPSLTSADKSVAAATLPLDLTVSMTYTDGTFSGETRLSESVKARANMLVTTMAEVSVTWES